MNMSKFIQKWKKKFADQILTVYCTILYSTVLYSTGYHPTTLHLSADFGTARYPHLADTCILLYRPVSSTHKHSKNNYCCDECGIVKDTVKKLQDHQHSHKTGICYKCAKTISCQNMPKHLKICKGVREKEMGKV